MRARFNPDTANMEFEDNVTFRSSAVVVEDVTIEQADLKPHDFDNSPGVLTRCAPTLLRQGEVVLRGSGIPRMVIPDALPA